MVSRYISEEEVYNMKKTGMLPGVLLITAGVLLLASNIGLLSFNWNFVWPLFLLVPGLVFELSFFGTGRNPGVLVPGGILTLYGLFFYFNIVTGWHFMDNLWPVFILGPGVGLFQLYVFGGRDRGVLIASSILGFISMVFLSFTLLGFAADYIGPAILILFGLFILTKNKRKDSYRDPYVHTKSKDDDLEEYYDTDDEDH